MTMFWGETEIKRLRTQIRSAFVGFIVAMLLQPVAALECLPLPLVAVDTSAVMHQQGLLWEVTNSAGDSSFVLGTMHISDARIQAVMDESRSALASSVQFAMEVVLDIEAMTALQAAMFYSDGSTLRDDLGGELFEHIATLMSAHGIPANILMTMKPWAVYSTLSLPSGAIGVPLDLQLMLLAQASDMPVAGLESIAEQISIFESVPTTEQVDMLSELACHYEAMQNQVEALVERYAARDLMGLYELSLRHVDSSREAFIDVLLWQRNDRMVLRMQPMLDRGGAFIAIGALHLAGAKGILQQLERAGYGVSVVY